MCSSDLGTNPEKGWVLYYAYPSDRGPGCKVEQVEKTDRFVDCEGRTIAVSDLSPPTAGEFPVIEDRRTLYIDLGDRPGDAPTTIGP